MNDYISLQSVTPTNGIFTALNSFSVPWKNVVDPELIDLQYYGNVSGEKIISPLVYKQLNNEGKLTDAKQSLIASMIFSMFGTNWAKEWETLSMQYDPIANYDMTETMTDDETVTEYGKTNTRTNNLVHAKTGTETDAPSVSVATNDTVHGFNSSDPVPTDGRSQSTSGSDITTYNIYDTDTGTSSDAGSGSDTSTRNYELTRKGNIGVTSSQQLLQSERDLWVWNYFLDVVFPDVDKILTIPIYAEETGYNGSGGEPSGTINITENGLNIDVKQFAFADVAVPNTYTVEDQGKVVYGDTLVGQTTRTVTENGEYDTTLNREVTVSVPNTYTTEDQGKVVYGDTLVGQTTRTVTENGEYDTTLNNEVIVNLPSGPFIALDTQYDDNHIYFGRNPPSNDVGVDGDYYYQRVDNKQAYPTFTASGSTMQTRAGYEFVTNGVCKVTGLCALMSGSSVVNIALYNTSGDVIASVSNVSIDSGGKWVVAPLAEPVTLSANTHYIVMVEKVSGGSIRYAQGTQQPGTNLITFEIGRYGTPPGTQESNTRYSADIYIEYYYNITNSYIKESGSWNTIS